MTMQRAAQAAFSCRERVRTSPSLVLRLPRSSEQVKQQAIPSLLPLKASSNKQYHSHARDTSTRKLLSLAGGNHPGWDRSRNGNASGNHNGEKPPKSSNSAIPLAGSNERGRPSCDLHCILYDSPGIDVGQPVAEYG